MTPDGDDEDLDDASLKSMRAVWLSMRDEEPPAAGMSALLAAAAEKAEQLRGESHPWWRRVLDMLRRPPALAFATVMILIGGAVLVTRTADRKTASEVASPSPALESRDVQMGSGAARTPVDELEQKEETLKDTAPPPPPPTIEKPPVVKRATKVAKPTKPTEDAKPEPSRDDRFEDGATKIEAQKGQGGAISGTTLETPGRVKSPGADKGPGLQQAPEIDSTSEAEVVSAPKQPATPLEQLARQAETAAARGDCAAVKAIVARIKQQDEAFFKARLGKTAAVSKCL